MSAPSRGEQKRLVLEALLRGSDEVLMLDELTGSCWIGSPPGSPRWSRVPPARPCGFTQAVSRRPTGADRPEQQAGGAAPPLGRGARKAQDAGDHVKGGRTAKQAISGRRPWSTRAWCDWAHGCVSAASPRPISTPRCWAAPGWRFCTGATSIAAANRVRKQPGRWTGMSLPARRSRPASPLRGSADAVPDLAAQGSRRHRGRRDA